MFAIEVVIALYLNDAVIRPYLGDSLAVAFVYLLLRAALPVRAPLAAGVAFAIACAIEVGQAFHLVDRIGLGHSRVARVLFGTHYDPRDFVAYAIGAVTVLLAEGAIAAYRRR
ncbi:ribosomal maturation YjgA family protein [Sphingomonas sp. RB3P16]|uniref:ribosomal maturation YjgA family protein n=1 Tax=Parasphingomonas frigoris TaxID=3096163 RepID=UPI002FCC65FE